MRVAPPPKVAVFLREVAGTPARQWLPHDKPTIECSIEQPSNVRSLCTPHTAPLRSSSSAAPRGCSTLRATSCLASARPMPSSCPAQSSDQSRRDRRAQATVMSTSASRLSPRSFSRSIFTTSTIKLLRPLVHASGSFFASLVFVNPRDVRRVGSRLRT